MANFVCNKCATLVTYFRKSINQSIKENSNHRGAKRPCACCPLIFTHFTQLFQVLQLLQTKSAPRLFGLNNLCFSQHPMLVLQSDIFIYLPQFQQQQKTNKLVFRSYKTYPRNGLTESLRLTWILWRNFQEMSSQKALNPWNHSKGSIHGYQGLL